MTTPTPIDGTTPEQKTVTISAESLRWLVAVTQDAIAFVKFETKSLSVESTELQKAIEEAGRALERL